MKPHTGDARPRFSSALAAGAFTLLASGSVFAQVDSSQELGQPRPLVSPGDPNIKEASAPLVKEAPTQETLARLAAVLEAEKAGNASIAAAKADLPVKMTPRTRITDVAYDVEADGSLWVRGAGYKASFNADGFTFIPYLGSTAPQNYPVHFQLQSIDVGGQPLALEAPVVTREDNRITIDRGAVQEVYIITLASVEQQFIFSQQPGIGQANILMNVNTELAGSNAGEQIEFTNERGAVRYTRAITVDANDITADSPTNFANGQIFINVPAETVNNAAYPLVVDPIITPFVADGSDGVDDRDPDVAYDVSADGYLLVWENVFSAGDHDVATERYTWSGNFVAGSFAWVDFSSQHWRNVSVANNNNANNYLVVGEVGADADREIWARIRESTSNTMGTKTQISDSATTGAQYNADVGGDPFDGVSYYIVVWQRDFSAGDRDIFCQRVDRLTGAPSGAVVLIENSGGTLYQKPSISKSKVESSEEWMVVYEFANDPNDVDIYGALIDWDGAIAEPNFSVDTSGVDNRNPAVSSRMDNGMYTVVYEESPTGLGDIYCRVFDGTVIQDGNNLTTLEGVDTADPRRLPSVDSDGDRQVVTSAQDFTASDWDPYVSTYCFDGDIRVAEQHRNLDYTGSDTRTTNVACAAATGGFSRETMLTFDTVSSGTGFGTIEGAFYTAKSSCCVTDVTNNGSTGVADLLEVIGSWGGFVLPTADGDVNGDLSVNVADLLSVIAGWGPCP